MKDFFFFKWHKKEEENKREGSAINIKQVSVQGKKALNRAKRSKARFPSKIFQSLLTLEVCPSGRLRRSVGPAERKEHRSLRCERQHFSFIAFSIFPIMTLPFAIFAPVLL